MSPFFDTLIILFLSSATILAWVIFRDRQRLGTWEFCHKTISICLFAYLLICLFAVVWGSFIEPRLIVVNKVSLDLPNFEPTQPVKVAFISDVHTGTYKKDGWIKKISQRILEIKPDLVLIAGDFIVDRSEQSQYLSAFSILHSAFPVYAVLGDHEYRLKKKGSEIVRVDEESADAVTNTLKNAGVQVLRNETKVIRVNNAEFLLVGLDDWLSGKTKFPSLSDGASLRDGNLPVIALVHNPDLILNEESKKADLVLAGHTHGGQIRLPLIGAVPTLPIKILQSFDQGLFTLENNNKLFISSGVGESGPRARLFNPPEIVILELN